MKVNISKLSDNLRECTAEVAAQLNFTLDGNGYEIIAEEGETLNVSFDGKVIKIIYPAINQFFRGLRLVKQNFNKKGFSVSETCKATELGIMLDCSRNAVRNINHLKELIRHLALMGYNQIQLYTEDTYEVESEPYFGYMRGRYTIAEMKEIDDYAARFGIEAVPCIQTLAHLNQIFRWEAYKDINDIYDILLIDEDRTYELIEHMFITLDKCFRSRKIHIGMDEAHFIGRGKFEDKHGSVEKRSEIMLRHLNKVVEIASRYGYKPMMWSDMFFRLAFNGAYYVSDGRTIDQEVIELVPENLRLVYWDYYNNDPAVYNAMIERHQEFNREVMFAGGAWMWSGFAPSNKFSLSVTKTALKACEEKGVDKIMITMWGDEGAECSDMAVLPVLCYAAEFEYGHEDYSAAFYALTDMEAEKFLDVESANLVDEYLEPNHNNPSKYMLYNDCIGGLMDPLVKEGDAAVYEKHIRNLKAVEKIAGRYSYIFTTQRCLCEALQIKYELGVKTRNAYKTGDPKAIKDLVKTLYYPLIKKLEQFYAALEYQWSVENKPHGFEVQDYRLGGLIKRVEHCAARLIRFANGKDARIEELEEIMLDPFGNSAEVNKRLTTFNNFGKNIGVNQITWH